MQIITRVYVCMQTFSIGVTICLLKIREKKDDEKEKDAIEQMRGKRK
jgi:cytochrome bd-type quinol oxidase subunit 2